MSVQAVNESFAVSGQIRSEDVADIAAAGFRTVICNRPDNEELGQPSAQDIADACTAHELAFHYLPFKGSLFPPGLPEQFVELVRAADGPVLAYCRSGQRSGFLWASVRHLLG